jgi:glycosyltransferase involved in cell wall biosynthesis
MKKVSILTPCYNGALFIHRLLDSILVQTYPNIEMFVINDGSMDNSEEIVKSYIPKFKDRGINLKCVNQPNQGQAAAINNGLKLISGDYLIWPDSDDFFASKESIAKMAAVLNEKPDFSVVRTFANLLDENTLKKVGEHGGKKYSKNKRTDLFEDCLFTTNDFWYGAGDYMIRLDVFKQTYTDMNIFVPSKYGGQNWQLMLPVLYKQKCFTIEEFLYNILVRKQSHSRGLFRSLKDVIKKNEEYEKTILVTLKRINMPTDDYENYKTNVYIKYLLNRIDILLLFGYKNDARKIFLKLKNEYKSVPFKDQVLRIRIKMLPFVNEAKKVIRGFMKK